MDLDQVMRMLKGKSEVKLVKFVSDKGPNSCEKCLAFHGRVFRADDPEKPELPIHPHCRCRYEELSESEVKSFQNEVLEVKDQVVALGNKVAARATQLLEEFEREINAYSVTALAKGAVTALPLLLKMTEIVREKKELEKQISSKADSAKINALFTGLQISYAAMQAINQAARATQREMETLGVSGIVKEISSWSRIQEELFAGLKNLHYNRLALREQQLHVLPKSPEEAIKQGFVKAPDKKSVYHRNRGKIGNVKYYRPDTGQEVVFKENRTVETAPENIGTKNFGPIPGTWEHIWKDVFPYWLWGNSPDDTTPASHRIFGAPEVWKGIWQKDFDDFMNVIKVKYSGLKQEFEAIFNQFKQKFLFVE